MPSLIFLQFFSVANTAKRAILIWLSILVFGNEVTFLSAAGTAVVIIGVFLYHKARETEEKIKAIKKRSVPVEVF